MPGTNDDVAKLERVGKVGAQKAVGIFDDFIKFIKRGNVADLAVGIIIGAAFSAIVTSLVNDIIGPFIALATSQSGLKNMFVILRRNTSSPNTDYATPNAANEDGVVTWNYGNFIATIIHFLIVSIVIFFIVKLISAIWRKKKQEKTDWPCPKCKEDVKLGAIRCSHCCAEPISPEDNLKPALVAKHSGEKVEQLSYSNHTVVLV